MCSGLRPGRPHPSAAARLHSGLQRIPQRVKRMSPGTTRRASSHRRQKAGRPPHRRPRPRQPVGALCLHTRCLPTAQPASLPIENETKIEQILNLSFFFL